MRGGMHKVRFVATSLAAHIVDAEKQASPRYGPRRVSVCRAMNAVGTHCTSPHIAAAHAGISPLEWAL